MTREAARTAQVGPEGNRLLANEWYGIHREGCPNCSAVDRARYTGEGARRCDEGRRLVRAADRLTKRPA